MSSEARTEESTGTGTFSRRDADASPLAVSLEAVAVAILYALLNRFSEKFQVAPDVSILYPPTAVAVVAGFRLGFAAIPAIILGTFLSPWASEKSRPLLTLAFGAVNALEALLPALAARWRRFDRRLGDARSLALFVVCGLVLNTGLNAFFGNLLRSATSEADPGGGIVFSRVVLWWIADFAAALILAMPLLVLLPRRFDRGALSWRPDPTHLRVAAGLVAAVALVAASRLSGFGHPHWFAFVFLIPVLDAALEKGFRAGIGAAAAASLLYLGANLLSFARSDDRDQVGAMVVTIYVNTVVWFLAGAITGHLSSHRRKLLADLDRRNRMLKDDFFRVVATLSAAIEARDRATIGHVYRVARTAVAIGKKLGLSPAKLETLNYAAILHDLGKFGIPDRILMKTSSLAPDERALVKNHGAIGARILENVDLLRPVVAIVLHHQDHWDGDREPPLPDAPFEPGRGEAIPLEARIVAVADAYDALTSERPYRNAVSRESAVDALRAERGKQFDPAVVDAFCDVLQERGDIPRGVVPVSVIEN